jgi:hypothetical protein
MAIAAEKIISLGNKSVAFPAVDGMDSVTCQWKDPLCC